MRRSVRQAIELLVSDTPPFMQGKRMSAALRGAIGKYIENEHWVRPLRQESLTRRTRSPRRKFFLLRALRALRVLRAAESVSVAGILLAMTLNRQPDALTAERWDVLIVGGGIVGSAIARDAAMRGLRSGSQHILCRRATTVSHWVTADRASASADSVTPRDYEPSRANPIAARP